MSRPVRITLWIVGGIAGLIVLLVIAGIIVVQTAWFRNYVREKIIAYAEEATGGRVELKKFGFDWTHMHVELDGFVLHGTEPVNVPPLFSANKITVYLRLLPSFSNIVQLNYLGVDQPGVDVIVYPDGHTNVPAPKVKTTSNKTTLETIVDLAIRKFDINNGTILFAEKKSDFSAHGENLRAQLNYNFGAATYDGSLAMAPLHLQQQGRPPVDLNVTLPLHLERDKVQLTNATITTGDSKIVVTGEMNHLVQPHESGHVNATIALADLKKAAGASLPIRIPPNGPSMLDADATFSMEQDHINVSGARIGLGASNIEASGALKDPSGNTALDFKSRLVLTELAKLYPNAYNPQGVVNLNGKAKLVGANDDYYVNGDIEAKDLSFTDNGERIRNVNLYSAIDANKQAVEFKGMRLAAFGGTFNGNAGIENMARFHVDGRLANFDIGELATTFAHERVGYDGVISGPVQVAGDIKSPSKLAANTHLTITPGRKGVPVRGKLDAAYNGATGSINVDHSWIALPNSRLDLSGSVGQQLQIHLVSHNLNDFLPAMQMGSKNPPTEMPIALRSGGLAEFTGTVTGKLAAPRIAGHVSLTNFEAQQRPFDSLVADLSASPSGASVQNAALASGTLQARFNASVGLDHWKAASYEPIAVNATVANAGIADIMALAGQKPDGFSGTLNASAQIGGTIGDPRGNANLNITNLVAYQEHFDQIAGNVNFSDRRITIPDMRLTAGPNRMDLTATYDHAADSLENGHLHVTLASNTMQLAQFEAVKRGTPELTGTLNINADVTADVRPGAPAAAPHGPGTTARVGRAEVHVAGARGPEVTAPNQSASFILTGVNVNVAAHGLRYQNTAYGDLTATAQTAGNLVSYNVNSDFAGSTIHATGETRLAPEYPTTANLNIANLRVERVLAVAGRQDIPFTGVLSTTAQLSGTLNDPHANADLTLTNADYYEHFDRIQGRIEYSKQFINIPSLEAVSGSARAQLAASFTPQPPGQFQAGRLTFKLNTNQIQLAQLKGLAKSRPGIGGVVEVNAQGAATLQNAPGQPRVLFSSLNAQASATGLSLNKKPYGDLRLAANTSGNELTFNLDSDFAGSKIHGQGRAALTADYPITANLDFSNVHYINIRDWLQSGSSLGGSPFDIAVDGSVNVSGPLTKTADLKATLRLPRVEVLAQTHQGIGNATTYEPILQNQGPIVASLDRSLVRVDNGHITGRGTDIAITGTATLQPKQDLNLRVDATTNLKLIQQTNRDMYTQGSIVLHAGIRGPLTDPTVNGQMQLQNASLNNVNWPVGLDHANGLIVFNGKTATIQTLTLKSGGGDIAVTGSAGYTNGAANFNLAAKATNVRVRSNGATVIANANITLTGATDNSTVGGAVTVQSIAFNPHSDFGSLLSNAAMPVQTPAAPSPFLANMHLKIGVQTSPALALQTSLAQNIQMTASLRVTGTASTPGMLGRVNITQGTLVFFGTSYTVDQGIISFYNPLRIEPVLDINLETHVQGVDIILGVSGPVDDMKLTHRSDPPLPFNEVIALLATGKAPSSDPVLAAHAAPTPPQTTQQMGESALLGQVVANPIANRLQRVFGISQLKIAPAFVSGSELPQARMTLQQQVTSNLTFTYITDLTNSNEQVVRAELAINPRWSAVATRDENGIISIDFFYKRRIR